VVGIKSAFVVQAICQQLCDLGKEVYFVPDCIGDDDKERLDAIVKHFLPLYATSQSVDSFLEACGGNDVVKSLLPSSTTETVKYVSDCGRGGHMALYTSHLLRREEWVSYPTQPWYSGGYLGGGKQFNCPLAKQFVHFCDEPQFSRSCCMFIKGREWLNEKDKLLDIAREQMPERVVWKGQRFESELPMNGEGLWFVKKVDENAGGAVDVFDSITCASGFLKSSAHLDCYIVQRHVQLPLLSSAGMKHHVKCYCLLHNRD